MHLLSQDCLVFATFPNYLEFPRHIFTFEDICALDYIHILCGISFVIFALWWFCKRQFSGLIWNFGDDGICVYNSWSKYAQCKSDPNMVPLPWLSSDLWQSCRLWRKAHINPKPYQARHKSPAAPWRTQPKYKRLEQMTWRKIEIYKIIDFWHRQGWKK